jgi:heme/copper-type cytochrome/quinol oxidase subunit 3
VAELSVHPEIRARHIVPTPEEEEFELRAGENSIFTGGRLLVGIATFAYASLAFAYFYLRSANNEDLWRPKGITAPTAIGAAIFAIGAASAALNAFGVRRLRAGVTTDWLVAGWLAVLGGLVALGLQIYELTRLPFYPGSSGYASCFIGWVALNVAALFAATYWLETVLAKAMRLRRSLAVEEHSPGGALPSIRLFRANLESCSYFWLYLALASLLFWLLFYVL